MKFTLTIELGNEAMQTLTEVTNAFKESAIAYAMGFANPDSPLELGETVTLKDANGNTVGKWEVTEPAKPLTNGELHGRDGARALGLNPDKPSDADVAEGYRHRHIPAPYKL